MWSVSWQLSLNSPSLFLDETEKYLYALSASVYNMVSKSTLRLYEFSQMSPPLGLTNKVNLTSQEL